MSDDKHTNSRILSDDKHQKNFQTPEFWKFEDKNAKSHHNVNMKLYIDIINKVNVFYPAWSLQNAQRIFVQRTFCDVWVDFLYSQW